MAFIASVSVVNSRISDVRRKVLGLAEILLHVVVLPPFDAPRIVVRRGTVHVHHRVNGRAPAEHLPARPEERTPIELRLRSEK